MYNTKNLIGLPVLSLYEGELNGHITNVYFDKKLKKVLFFSLTGEGDLKYILHTKNVYKVGKNAITIKNNACLVLDLDENKDFSIPAPFESKTYTIQGEFIGKISHITFNEKYFVDEILLDNDKKLDCSNLASCSKNTILVYDKNTHINVSKFKNRAKPKMFQTKLNHKVETLPVQAPPTIEPISTDITLPNNASNQPDFLIGRIVLNDIVLDDNKILIKANSTISDRTLSLAIAHNKIKELMLNSKQK